MESDTGGTWGKKFFSLAKSLGVTQGQLGSVMGLTQQGIRVWRKYEFAPMENIGWDRAAEYCRLLDLKDPFEFMFLGRPEILRGDEISPDGFPNPYTCPVDSIITFLRHAGVVSDSLCDSVLTEIALFRHKSVYGTPLSKHGSENAPQQGEPAS